MHIGVGLDLVWNRGPPPTPHHQGNEPQHLPNTVNNGLRNERRPWPYPPEQHYQSEALYGPAQYPVDTRTPGADMLVVRTVQLATTAS